MASASRLYRSLPHRILNWKLALGERKGNHMKLSISRRNLLAGAPLVATALAAGPPTPTGGKPAILGGPKAFSGAFPGWPVYDQTEERALIDTLRTGKWYRGSGQTVGKFEEAYARLTGARCCLA